MSTLQLVWFLLIAILFAGYTALAGFDLGIAVWYLLAKKDEERQTLLGAIGPFWDGNQVWLVTGGAALFAAFPIIYATAFSGFYLALILLLVALITRSVAIEFGARGNTPGAIKGWGLGFALGSIVAMLLLGTALGNVLRGLPLNAAGDFTGNFFTLLNPYSLLIGVLNLALLATHGAAYVAMKAVDELAAQARAWVRGSWMLSFVLAIAALTLSATQPHLLHNYLATPVLWIFPLLTVGALLAIPILNARNKDGLAFASSFTAIFALFATVAAALYPVMLPALGHPEWNLTAHNASSSYLTLRAMLIIACIGLPIAYAYTIWSYRLFRGKIGKETHY